ncbi:MAG: Glu/Leu/Phe/Val dehydrogenase dimerization domain-containing protein [Solirubrobacteraceae bacterium]
MTGFEDAIRGWDGEQVVCRFDGESGSWMFICIHSRLRGPAAGGTRIRAYPAPVDGLLDAMRLASGMTRKTALADLPLGGGKAVIAVPEVPRGAAKAELLGRYAEMVNTLGGSFLTGPDMNTYAEDLDLIKDACPYIFGSSASAQDGRTVADSTALGVLRAIQACMGQLDGNEDLHGRTVVVQGIGGVGGSLARQLVDAGAVVKVCDLDADRIAALTASHAVEVIAPEAALTTPADVLAPCAAGGVLTAEVAATLPVRIVAGCANDQLADLRAADALQAAGVLYAPDYVANSGGAVHCLCVESLGMSSPQVLARIDRIGDTLREVFELSSGRSISTAQAAEQLAADRLQR